MHEGTPLSKSWSLFFTGFTLFIITIIVLKNSGGGDWFFALFTWIPRHDKVGHFVLMGILGFLAVAALAPRLPFRPWLATLSVLVPLVLLIAIEEGSQYFVASRSFSMFDLVCSVAGVVVLGGPAHVLVRRTRFPVMTS